MARIQQTREPVLRIVATFILVLLVSGCRNVLCDLPSTFEFPYGSIWAYNRFSLSPDAPSPKLVVSCGGEREGAEIEAVHLVFTQGTKKVEYIQSPDQGRAVFELDQHPEGSNGITTGDWSMSVFLRTGSGDHMNVPSKAAVTVLGPVSTWPGNPFTIKPLGSNHFVVSEMRGNVGDSLVYFAGAERHGVISIIRRQKFPITSKSQSESPPIFSLHTRLAEDETLVVAAYIESIVYPFSIWTGTTPKKF